MARTFEIEELLAHAGWLRSLARSLVADPAAADDLVQDTWIAALRRPPRADRSPRPWLARVAHNLARNARRNARTRGEHEEHGEHAHEEHGPLTPDAIAEEVEAQQLLAEAVASLAEPARTIVVLRWYRGLDSPAIARELGLPAGTVRWRLKQALEELRGDLDRRRGGREAWAGLLSRFARIDAPASAALATASSSWFVGLALTGTVAMAALGAAAWRLASPTVRHGVPASETRLVASPVNASSPTAALLEPGESLEARSVVTVVPEPAGREIVGTVLLEGRPAALKVELQASSWTDRPRFARAGPDGRFRFSDVRARSGSLRVPGYAPEDGSAATFDALGPAELELRVKDGPLLTGRFLLPRDHAPIPIPPGPMGFNGYYQYSALEDGDLVSDSSGVFCTDDEGGFRIPLHEGETVRMRLHVEVYDQGRKVVDVPDFERIEGFDLGDVVLEPGVSVPFRVLDAGGEPVGGAWAMHEDWFRFAQCDASGAGVILCVPMDGAPIRFGSKRHRDQVLFVRPGDRPEIFLERTNALQISVGARDRGPLPALRIFIAPHEALFLDTEDTWPNAVFDAKACVTESAPGAEAPFCSVIFEAGSTGELLLRDLAPGLPFTVEVRTPEGRTLAVRDCVLGEREWQELVIPIER